MSEKIKNYLGVVLILSLLAVGYGVLSYVNSYARNANPSAYRSFSVTGEGKAVSIPDVATFTFSVITEGGKDVSALQKTNTDKVNKAIDFVKGQGVADKDIKTQSYDVYPRYQYSSCFDNTCPPPVITGHTVTQSVLVKVRDFTKTGSLLGGVVDNGANQVSQLTFTVDDPASVQDEARAEAIKKAQAKAKSVAQAGGFRLGDLLSLDEGLQYPQPYYAYGLGGAEVKSEAGGGGGAPAIEPGSQDVVVTVTLRYEIK